MLLGIPEYYIENFGLSQVSGQPYIFDLFLVVCATSFEFEFYLKINTPQKSSDLAQNSLKYSIGKTFCSHCFWCMAFQWPSFYT